MMKFKYILDIVVYEKHLDANRIKKVALSADVSSISLFYQFQVLTA